MIVAERQSAVFSISFGVACIGGWPRPRLLAQGGTSRSYAKSIAKAVLAGYPGFMRSPDRETLVVDACCIWDDPQRANLIADAPLGMLGIELETRRRNRTNGTVVALSDRGFSIRVAQSFGNCPQSAPHDASTSRSTCSK